MLAVRLEVEGRVQGVGFRWYVREQARELDLSGWVRNRADGTVEIAVAGPPGAIDSLVSRVREGPPGARVDIVRKIPLDPAQALDSPFAIIR